MVSSRPFRQVWFGALALVAVFGTQERERGVTEVVPECSDEERDAMSPRRCCAQVTPVGTPRRFAYMTVLGGVSNSYAYRGYLYNVAIMGRLFRKYGSIADVVVVVLMQDLEIQEDVAGLMKPACATPPANRTLSRGNPPLSRLPPEDEELLAKNGVIVKYSDLLYGIRANFNTINFAKSLVFRYTEYEAIQFLDADVMPLGNMDAAFALEGVTCCAGTSSPLNGGWLRLSPNCDDYRGLRDLVTQANEWGNGPDPKAPHRTWSAQEGWGHGAVPRYQRLRSDSWDIGWDFYGASVDQGLFYYYFTFVKKELTQIRWRGVNFLNADGIQAKSFPPDPDENPDAKQPTPDELELNATHPRCHPHARCLFKHFVGGGKPWIYPRIRSPWREHWWEVFAELDTGLDRAKIKRECFNSPLGYKPELPPATEAHRRT